MLDLQPGWESLKKAWLDDSFTYTWLRDNFFLPSLSFFTNMLLEEDGQEHILNILEWRLSPILAAYVKQHSLVSSETLSIVEFSKRVKQSVLILHQQNPSYSTEFIEEAIDGVFYDILPLTPTSDLKHNLRSLLGDFMDEELDALIQQVSMSSLLVDRRSLLDLAKTLFMLRENKCLGSVDIEKELAEKGKLFGLHPPSPFVCADSNWPWNFFAFLVNPSTLQLEFWRTDRLGSRGYPMVSWKKWFGKSSKSSWTILSRPEEYS